MKTLQSVFMVMIGLVCATPALGGEWLEDYRDGLAQAQAEDKLLLVRFVGSDWCQWCIRLDREILNDSDLIDDLSEDFVLVTADFPRFPKDQDLLQRNRELQKRVGVTGYPTLVVMDKQGLPFAYQGIIRGPDGAPFDLDQSLYGDPQTYVNRFAELKRNVDHIRNLREESQTLKDEESAKKLASALELMLTGDVPIYRIEEFRADVEKVIEHGEDDVALLHKKSLSLFDLTEHIQAEKPDEALELGERILDDLQWTAEERQLILNCLGTAHYQKGDLAEAIERLQEAVLSAPMTELGTALRTQVIPALEIQLEESGN